MHRPSFVALLGAALLAGCHAEPPTAGSEATAPEPDGVATGAQGPATASGAVDAGIATRPPAEVVVSTNEPFWQATAGGSDVVLRGPDVEGRRFAIESAGLADGVRTIRGVDADGAIELRVRDRACEDSMSGAALPYSGELVIDGGEPVAGCARDAGTPPPGEPGPLMVGAPGNVGAEDGNGAVADAGDRIPPRFHGRWARDAAACASPGSSIEDITIDARALRFHESLGVPTRVVEVDAETVRVESDYSGEGEAWRSAQTLRLEDRDVLVLTGPADVRLRRVRCG